jgi:hypothetical protein
MTAEEDRLAKLEEDNRKLRAELDRVAGLYALAAKAKNRSSASKRDMGDEDALRVLTGDLAEADHKTAGDALGLTYAQVYSCRLEYTFKHVHKKLANAGWRNHWLSTRRKK